MKGNFEADFNLGMKILYSCRMMPHGDRYHFSGEEAQGGRQGQTTHDLISNIQYTTINAAVMRQPISLCFNDQKGNFDRIRLNLNTISSQQMGMPKNAAVCHAKTLCHMKHHVQTIYGDSSECIFPTIESAGIGQGSGGGGPCNHVQAIPMLDVIQQKTLGCTIRGPDGRNETTQHVVTWIDDCTLKQSYSLRMTTKQMIACLIYLCQLWRRIIRITGGDLSLAKCCIYLITWKFECMNCKARMTTTQDVPGIITFRDDFTSENITIKKKPKKS